MSSFLIFFDIFLQKLNRMKGLPGTIEFAANIFAIVKEFLGGKSGEKCKK
jgi:hypothetical protein